MADTPVTPTYERGWLVHALVEDREMVRAVRLLEPGVLGELVRHVGIEDSGGLLALATPEQLRGLADDDLWRANLEGTESFDAGRFGLWVEVLVEEGIGVAADALVALDEDLLAHALGNHMLVLDLDALAPLVAAGISGIDDPELVDRILETSLSHELDELLLLSTRYDGWDAIVEVIMELDRRDHALVRRVLDHVCAATMHRASDDGLHSILTEAESLEADARGARDDRRERRGYVAAADARAFLAGARERGLDTGDDPVTRSYFRNFDPKPTRPDEHLARLSALLDERGVLPAPRLLTQAAASASPTRAALQALAERDPMLHARRAAELVYLANVLMAARGPDEPALDRVAALDAAIVYCDAGCEIAGPDRVETDGLIGLFGAGWRARPAP